MRILLAAALLAAPPVVGLAQPSPSATESPAPPGSQAAPPLQGQSSPPPSEYASPPQYAPPPPQYAPPPPQYAPPPPQYAPPAQGQPAPPPGYPPPPPGYEYALVPQVRQATAPPPPPILAPYQRDTWYIGFGLGGGDGTLRMKGSPSFTSGDSSFDAYLGSSPSTLTLNFKIGATLTPRLLLGGDITAIRSDAREAGADLALQISTYHAVATFFPVERGFFVRGGLGVARFSYEFEDAVGRTSASEVSGPSALLGVGYAWWLGRQFNLTANVDFSAQSYRSKADALGALPKSSRFWALWLGFDWY